MKSSQALKFEGDWRNMSNLPEVFFFLHFFWSGLSLQE
jgi:hypothetical protein